MIYFIKEIKIKVLGGNECLNIIKPCMLLQQQISKLTESVYVLGYHAFQWNFHDYNFKLNWKMRRYFIE